MDNENKQPIDARSDEEKFHDRVRPYGADTAAELWQHYCAPVLELFEAFGKWTTTQFVNAFNKKEDERKKDR